MSGGILPARIAAAVDVLHRHWAGRPVVMLAPSFNGETRTVMAELAGCGAEVVGLITAGAVPSDAPELPHVFSCAERGIVVPPEDFGGWLGTAPTVLCAWLGEVDPERTWTAAGWSLLETGDVCGRPVHGRRRPEWGQWEDKTRIEELFRATGTPSPAHIVLDLDDDRAVKQARALDAGHGVVVSHDATKFCLGGAESVRWVRRPEELAGVLNWARDRSERVRIAEFVRGVPCSVLGMVLADGVAVFDPIELVMLADDSTGRLEFGGFSDLWRPDPAVAQEIRGHAGRIGAWLAQHVGFRGLFSFDGILGERGFVATELNPRQSAGLGVRRAWPGFPLNLFQRAAQEALPGVFDLPSSHVEAVFRETMRAHSRYGLRIGGSLSLAPGEHELRIGGDRTVRYAWDGRSARVLTISPEPPVGALIAPTAVEVGRALGRADLVSPL